MPRGQNRPPHYRKYLDRFREQFVEELRRGTKHDAIAMMFRVHPSTVSRYIRHLWREGVDI